MALFLFNYGIFLLIMRGNCMEDELGLSLSMINRTWKLIHELGDVILWCDNTHRETELTRAWLNAVAKWSRTAEITARRPHLSALKSPQPLREMAQLRADANETPVLHANHRPDFVLPERYVPRILASN
jgi:hypothetical protein